MLLFTALVVAVSYLATSAQAGQVVGYYPDYRYSVMAPSTLPFNKLDCIHHFSLTPKADGRVVGISDARMREMVGLTSCVNIVVGGAGRSSAFRTAPISTLAANIVAVVRNYGYAGVEIDWEPLNNTDDGRFQTFIRTLRSKLPASKTLSVAVAYPYRNKKDSKLEKMVGGVAGRLTNVVLMAYGMSGPWPGWVSWPGAAQSSANFPGTAKPLPSIEEMVSRYAAAGVPKSKMLLGLPAFGHQWHDVWQSLQPAEDAWRGGEFQYKDIVTEFSSHLGASRCWSDSAPTVKYGVCQDQVAKVPYIWHNDTNRDPKRLYLPFDKPATWQMKQTWAENQGLRGVAIWEVTGDGPSHPLIGALQ